VKPDRGNPKGFARERIFSKGSTHGADFEYRFLVRLRIKRTHLLRQTTGGKAVFQVNGPDGRSCDLATDRIIAAIGHRFAPPFAANCQPTNAARLELRLIGHTHDRTCPRTHPEDRASCRSSWSAWYRPKPGAVGYTSLHGCGGTPDPAGFSRYLTGIFVWNTGDRANDGFTFKVQRLI
jgi:hypothetical protein